MEIITNKGVPHPYPDQPDDDTWEGEGGFVAKPNHIAYVMNLPDLVYGKYPRKVVIVHPLSYEEINHSIFTNRKQGSEYERKMYSTNRGGYDSEGHVFSASSFLV